MRHFFCYIMILLLSFPALAENKGIGLVIWSALNRPKTETNLSFFCSDHNRHTAFSINLYSQDKIQIYQNTGDGDNTCAPITHIEQFLKSNPSVQVYIDDAYENISSRYADTSNLRFNLIFNTAEIFQKEGTLSKIWKSFSLAAHANPLDWEIQLIVSEKQGDQLVDIDRIPMN